MIITSRFEHLECPPDNILEKFSPYRRMVKIRTTYSDLSSYYGERDVGHTRRDDAWREYILSQLITWCLENIPAGDCALGHGSYMSTLYFKTVEQAVHFKLSFGNAIEAKTS